MNIEKKVNRCIGYGLVALTLMHPFQPLMAAAITVKNNDTQIHNTSNVPIINIAKPNQAGISHNQFVDFNVTEKGAVLNNSTKAGQSQLAGQISANSNLNGTHAKLIINEVVGNGRSELKGKTEIFGQQGDILIANPNGITCDGCGFINTKGITLTTGTPTFDKNGAIEALTTTQGMIVIGPKGMDVSNVDYTDIISRTVELNGQVNAQNLNVIQGSNKIDYATGSVTTANVQGIKPVVSIDTKALGGMYANKIHLVSTENGVGVNLNNIVSTKNNIILAADGKIQLGNVTAKTNLNIKATTLDITNNKKVTSGGNITINADTVKNTQSQIISNKDMRIYADNIINTNAVIEANDNLWIQKDVNDTRSHSLKNISGTIKTNNGDLLIRADSVENISSALFTLKSVEPDSTQFNSIVELGGWFDDNENVWVSIESHAKLEGFLQKKWFDEIDLKRSNYINIARNIISYSSPSISEISSGRNLYINSNTLDNVYGHLISDNDMFLTGGKLSLQHGLSGEENVYLSYLSPNGVRYLPYKYLYQKVNRGSNDWYYFETIYRNINFKKNNEELVFNSKQDVISPIVAKGNLIADYKNDIIFSSKDIDKYHHITNSAQREPIISAGKDIVLNAKNIKGYGVIQSTGSTSFLASDTIDLENNHFISQQDLSLIAVNDIKVSQSHFSADNVTILSRVGNLKAITSDKKHYLDSTGEQIFGTWNIKNKLDIDVGKSITLSDQIISVGKNISLNAGESLTIFNSNALLDQAIYPTQKKSIITDEDNQNVFFNNVFNKTSNINIAGSATIRSGNNVNIDGVKLKTGQEVNIIAGNDIILAPRILDADLRKFFFPAEKEPELSSVIDSVGNVMITAGRDIYSKAATIESGKNIDLIAGRDFLLPAVTYTISKPNKLDIQHVVTDIKAGKKLTVAVNGDLIANGASFDAGEDMYLSAHGKMEFNSVVNSNETQLGNTKTASTTQQNVVLSSGGNLNILSDSSILLQATDLDADKSITAAAKGGFLFAQAMQETSFYESKNTKRKWYGKKKTTIKTSHNVVNKVVDFTANDNITLTSAGDSTYQASQIKAGKDIKLASTNGKVIFEGVKDTEFNQKIVLSKGFFIKYSDQGYEKETWKLPVIQAGGAFTVDAAKGISADIVAQKSQSLQNALTLLSNSDGTKWLKDLDKKGDVEWSKVQDAYSSWDYETQSLNPVVAAVIAIAVAIATSGVGLAAGGTVATSVGATGMAETVVINSVAAGISSLSSKAAVSLVENKGNVSKTLHDLASKDSVKSIATSMIIGGAMAGFDDAFNLTQNANPNANISALTGSEKLTLISNGDWGKVAQSVVGHSVIDAGINTAISGGSFKDRFSTALLSNVGNQLNAEAANFIGHSGYFNSQASKLIPHAVTSAIAAEIGGGSGKGAAAGAFAAELAAMVLGSNFESNSSSYNDYYQKMLKLGRLTGAVAGAIIARSPEGVYSGANAGYLVIENNYLSGDEMLSLDKEFAACKASGGNCDKVIQKYIDISNENSKMIQENCANGGVVCVTYEELVQANFDFSKGPADGQFYFGEIMTDEHAKALAQILNGADLKFLQDNISTTDRTIAIVTDPTSWPFMVFAGRNILINSFTKSKETLIAAGVSSGFNAAIQYGTTGEVRLSDVIGSGVVGSITAGKGYNPTVTWNAIGGYYTAELKGEDPFMGAILSKTGSGIGYASGSIIKIPFTKVFNSASQKYEMRPTGVWTITKPVPEHNLPPIIGNIFDSGSGEVSEKILGDKINDKQK
ncbi:contact-dependent inhibition toxin CdiA [Orbus sasakiae]|uniref:Contact-dependent inhibition toxin CdiA n=1 Tax=Orbus sasakiae TaxID=1078475 RepID=A0ABP9N7H5_9GAMM